ncbi:hypothetical protein GCM10027051_05370 [Niabella terrae]
MDYRRIKYGLVLIIMTASHLSVKGQGLKEWFSQKATQKDYMLQQIAGLRLYAGYLGRGYAIVSNGLATIGDLKGKHRNSDILFFQRLVDINPQISGAASIHQVFRLQQENLRLLRGLERQIRGYKNCPLYIVQYFRKLQNSMEREENEQAEALIALVSKGVYELDDRARLRRIHKITRDIQERHKRTKILLFQWSKLAIQIDRERKDLIPLNDRY